MTLHFSTILKGRQSHQMVGYMKVLNRPSAFQRVVRINYNQQERQKSLYMLLEVDEYMEHCLLSCSGL